MFEIVNFLLRPEFWISAVLVITLFLCFRSSVKKQIALSFEKNRDIATRDRTSNVTVHKNNAEIELPEKKNVSEQIELIRLISSDKSEISLKRLPSDLSSVEIDKYIQLPTMGSVRDGLSVKSALSSIAGGTTQAGLVSIANPNGLFSATVNPGLLTKFGDGTFSTMVHGSQGIVQNAGYQAASVSVFAPLIIFQAMSMVTGQYYLNGISKQLESIDKKINKLVQLHHVERLAKIRYSVNLIKKLHLISHPNIEDMVSLKMMENEIGIIHEEYVHNLTSLDTQDLKNSEKWHTSAKLDELYSKVNDASFDFNLNMAITTDEVLHLITVIELVMNARMSDHVENRAKRLGELLEVVKTWNSKEFYRARFGETSIADFYASAIEKAHEIYDKAILGKEKVKAAISDFKGKQAQIEENIGGKIYVLEMGQRLIQQMSEPMEILYLSNPELGDKVLVRR